MPGASPSVLSRLSSSDRQRLAAPLSDGAVRSLKSMFTNGLLRPIIPDHHAVALIGAGYARNTVGGLALTDEGQARAMLESGL